MAGFLAALMPVIKKMAMAKATEKVAGGGGGGPKGLDTLTGDGLPVPGFHGLADGGGGSMLELPQFSGNILNRFRGGGAGEEDLMGLLARLRGTPMGGGRAV